MALAPAEQIRIHTLTSLQKHIGFGLFLAAPIAGVGLARLIGDHFRRVQMAVAIWGTAMALGMTQDNNLFDSWPNSTVLVHDMAHYLRPRARYLVEADESAYLLSPPRCRCSAAPVFLDVLFLL